MNRRLPLLLFLAVLAWLVYRIVGDLLQPVIWAVILAYASWPLFSLVRSLCRGHSGLAASAMVLLLGIAVMLPLVGLMLVIQREAVEIANRLPIWLEQRETLQDRLAQIPYLGDELSRWVGEWGDLGELARQYLLPQIRGLSRRAVNMLGDVGMVAGQWILTLFLMFFLFRDGQALTAEVRHGLRLGLGDRADNYLDIAERTSRAVLYGIVLTAIVQGSVAGLGYWGIGLASPGLLTLLTIAMAPNGIRAMAVWLICCLWLLAQGETWQAGALLAWGSLVVSWVDNLVRPLVISQATSIPFSLIVLGILGGLLNFGFIGLFLGPIILAIAHAAWEEWLKTRPIAN